jgi:hypothetical protein
MRVSASTEPLVLYPREGVAGVVVRARISSALGDRQCHRFMAIVLGLAVGVSGTFGRAVQ